MEGCTPLASKSAQGHQKTFQIPDEFPAPQHQADAILPDSRGLSFSKRHGGPEESVLLWRLRKKHQCGSAEATDAQMATSSLGAQSKADTLDATPQVTGEALLERSATDATLLAQKAECLSKILRLGVFLHSVETPRDAGGACYDQTKLIEGTAGEGTETVSGSEEINAAFTLAKSSNKAKDYATLPRDSPSFLPQKGTCGRRVEFSAHKDSSLGPHTCSGNADAFTEGQGTKAFSVVPGMKVDALNEYFRISAGRAQGSFTIQDRGRLSAYQNELEELLDYERRCRSRPVRAGDPEERPHLAEGGMERIEDELASESGNEFRAKEESELSATEALFTSPCNDSSDEPFMPRWVRESEELRLARTAVLICLADLRDRCIPEVFMHPLDRRVRRKRVALHMMHVQECRMMQHLKPYMHLFELALVRDAVPHKLHPLAQRVLFSSLDMHARACESLYFPTYFILE